MHPSRDEEEAREGERIPRSHVDRRWTQGAQGEACEGQEAVDARWTADPQVTYSFPHSRVFHEMQCTRYYIFDNHEVWSTS